MSATSEQRRAAVVRRLKAEGPQPRVLRSGVDIDAVHYRLGAVTGAANAGTASGRQMVAASPAAVGAAPHSVGQRTEGGAV